MTIAYVKDLMTADPVIVEPGATLQEAAEKMKDNDCGVLPVGMDNHIKGIITDRDIVIRAIAQGKDPGAEKVSAYMTHHIFACNEEDTLSDAAQKMREHKVSRLLVRNRAGKITGILSFGGILRQHAGAADVVGVVERATSRLIA